MTLNEALMGKGTARSVICDECVSLYSWDRKNNPEPWNKMAPTDQYKVSSVHPTSRTLLYTYMF